MRSLALLVAFFIMCVGVTGIFMPDTLISVGRYVVTPNGLYAVAALRLGIGVVLMLVARVSRAPKTLRTLGAVVFVAGLATPFFGVDRARAVFDWEATQGTALIRIGAVLATLMGGFIAFAVAVGRRPAQQPLQPTRGTRGPGGKVTDQRLGIQRAFCSLSVLLPPYV